MERGRSSAPGHDSDSASGFMPAGFDNVITVASTNSNDGFSIFSNHGCEVAVAAPGSDVTAAWSTQTPLCNNLRPIPEDCISSVSGTSMASPHVAGIVARHLSALTEEEFEVMTPPIMQDILTATAVQDAIQWNVFPPGISNTTTNRYVFYMHAQL